MPAAIFGNDVIFRKTLMQEKIVIAGVLVAMPISGNCVGKESTLVQIKFVADKICTITVNHLNFKILRVL